MGLQRPTGETPVTPVKSLKVDSRLATAMRMRRFLAAGSLLVALLSTAACERRHHHVQHGPCSYTFLLPEMGHCGPAGEFQVTNSLQRDSAPLPGGTAPTEQDKKLTSLQNAMENNTQWLLKVTLQQEAR